MNSPVLTFTGFMMEDPDKESSAKRTNRKPSPRDEMTLNRIKRKLAEQLRDYEDDVDSPCSNLATSTIRMLDEEYKSMPRGFLD